MDIFSWEATLSELLCFPSDKGSTLKEKNLLPVGANSFLLMQILFRSGFVCRKPYRKSQKVVSLVNGEKKKKKKKKNLPSVSSP